MEQMRYVHLLIFCSIALVVWFLILYFLPRMIMGVYKKAVLVKGFGDGPIPLNTLYMQPEKLFTNPLQASGSALSTTGVNRDTLITIGWLDLRDAPQLLHVPDMAGRYYSVQLTDPRKNTVFAYVGKRTTGTASGEYLICGSNWNGVLPEGVSRISAPTDSVLIIGRVLVENDSDLPLAYELTKQIQLSSSTQP